MKYLNDNLHTYFAMITILLFNHGIFLYKGLDLSYL